MNRTLRTFDNRIGDKQTGLPVSRRSYIGNRTRRFLSAFSALVILTSAFVTLSLTLSQPAEAITAFGSVFTTNIQGDIVMAANSNMTCLSGCTVANSDVMSYVDIDGVAASPVQGGGTIVTFNSTTADVVVPTGSSVLFAGLFWGGNTLGGAGGADAPTITDRDKIYFRTPAMTGYQQLTATSTDIDTNSSTTAPVYHSFLDVTTIVQAVPGGGAGTYGAANIQSGTGSSGLGDWSGWTLVVAYSNPSQPLRHLNVYNGFNRVFGATAASSTDIILGPFVTPAIGNINAKIGLVAQDGDPGITNDFATLTSGTAANCSSATGSPPALSDAVNPGTNLFNSSITNGAANVATRNPAAAVTWGYDADIVQANNYLTNGSTSGCLRIGTTGDTYYLDAVTFSIELPQPRIVATKTANDLNGGNLDPGDIVEYSISMTNVGDDIATQVKVVDPLPSGLIYISNSMSVATGPGYVGTLTDSSADADVGNASGPLTASTSTFYVGVGASSTAGGTLAPGASSTVKLRATVDPATTGGTTFTNQVTITYRGATIPLQVLSPVVSATTTPVATRVNLGVTKSDGVTLVTAGNTTTYTMLVSNTGPQAAINATVTDNLSAAISGATWTCSVAGQSVAAACGALSGSGNIATTVDLGVNDTATYVVTAPILPTTPSGTGTLTNTVTVAAATGVTDTNTANNSATDVNNVDRKADLVVSKSDGITNAVPGTALSYTVVVTNDGPSTSGGLVNFADTVPAALTGVNWTCSETAGSSCTAATGSGNTINTTLTLDKNGVATFVVTGTLNPATASGTGTLANTATVTPVSGTTDPTPGNNTATDTDNVTPRVDLSITKSDGLVDAVPGTALSYSVVVANAGPSTATAAVITDTVPAALTGVSWTCTPAGVGASCGVSNGTGNAIATTVTLPTGTSATYVITATVSPSATLLSTIANTATVAAPAGSTDTDTSNNSATDSDTVRLALSLTKSAAVTNDVTPTGASLGDTVTYSFLVTNIGSVALNTVGVTDPLTGLSAISCPGTTLAVAASFTCTATRLITQADVNSGSIVNTATATGRVPSGSTVSAQSTVTTPIAQTKTLSLLKSVALTTDVAPSGVSLGDVQTFSFLVTNTGNVTLTSVSVSDPLSGLSSVTCPVTTLAPTGSTTCSATRTITQADVNAGSIINTASASGAPPSGAAITSNNSSTTTPINQTKSISLVKSVAVTTDTSPTGASLGDVQTFSFAVTNMGNVTLTAIGVSDPLAGLSSITCPLTVLAPDGSTTCTATRLITQSDVNAGSISNTATASGTPPSGAAISSNSSSTSTPIVQTKSMSLTKSVALTTDISPSGVSLGDVQTFSFLVANTGNVTLTSVTIVDPLTGLSAVTCPVTTLAPSGSTTCSATRTITQADVNAGSIINTASATGTPPSGAAITSNNSSTTTPINQTKSISLVKSVALTTDAAPVGVSLGDVQTFSFAVTNTGNVTLTAIGVTDPLAGLSAVTCPVTTLAPSGSTTCTATRTITQADVNAGVVTNTATASGIPPSGTAVTSASSSTSTPIVQTKSINLVKTVAISTDTSPSGASLGDTQTFSFLVTNTGNVTFSGVAISDPLIGLSSITCASLSLVPGGSTTCSATRTIAQADVNAGTIDNTATATGTPPSGAPVTSASSSTSTPIAQTKTITLTKSVALTTDTAPVGASLGDTQTFSFLVTNTGNVTVSAVAVTDPLTGMSSINCPLTILAPGRSTTCSATRTITQADVNAGSVDNTATASANPPNGLATTSNPSSTATPINQIKTLSLSKSVTLTTDTTPTGPSLGDTQTFSFLVTNTGNVMLTAIAIVDPLPGLSSISCSLTILTPGASTTCTATRIISQADVNAGSVSNTANASGTPPSGSPVTSNSSTTSTTIGQAKTLTLTKSVTLTADTAPTGASLGDTQSFSFVVTNTGNVTLTALSIADPLPGLSSISCLLTSLAPSGSTTCSAARVITQADVNAGVVTNTALASGNPPFGAAVTSNSSSTTTPINQIKTLSLTKSVALTTDISPSSASLGDLQTFSFAVVNTGNVSLTAVSVSDPLAGLSAVTCAATTLAIGGSTNCTATRTITQADVNAGSIVNTASASATPPSGVPFSSNNSSTTTPINQSQSISLTKTVAITTDAAPTGASLGDVQTFSFLVTNTGNVTLSTITVNDLLPGLSSVSCPATSLVPNASTTCTATRVISQANVNAGMVTNTATVSGRPPSGAVVTSASSSTSTPIAQTKNLTLTKSVAITTDVSPVGASLGDVQTFSFLVTNTGNVTLTSVSVADPLAGLSAITCPLTTLAPGASTTCSGTRTITQADVNAGSILNTASVSGESPSGTTITSNNSSTTTPIAQTKTITLSKSVAITSDTAPTGASLGDVQTFSFLVTNTGNVTLTSGSVADPLAGLSAISCPSITLAPGGSTTCSATRTITQADVNAGTIDNTATASGTPPSGALVTSNSSSTTTPINQSKVITLVKSVVLSNDTAPTGPSLGDTQTFSFLVANTGNVTLTSVGVSDPLVGLSAINCPLTTLAPGATTTCSATRTITQADVNAGSILNTATVSGAPPSGAAVTSNNSSTTTPINQSKVITLVKSVVLSNDTAPTGPSLGDTQTFLFAVTNTGNVTFTAVTVNDPLAGLSAITCPLTTLAPAGSTTCSATRTITQADVNAGTIDNTATASGTPPSDAAITSAPSLTSTPIAQNPTLSLTKSAALTTDVAPTGASFGDTQTFSFAVINTGNVTLSAVVVTDALPGLSAITCPLSTLAPGGSTTCTATRTITQADVDAGSVINTASATGLPLTGSAITSNTSSTTTPIAQTTTISVIKSASITNDVAPIGASLADTQTFSFLVTNNGSVTLTAVAVADPLPGTFAVTCPVTTLGPAASMTCTATRTITQADVDAGSISNTATASGVSPSGTTVTSPPSSTTTPVAQIKTITLTKSVSITTDATPSGASLGDTQTFLFAVMNTGNVTLTSVGITDPLVGLSAINCAATTLAPGTSMNCTATRTITQVDVDSGSIINTASASANPPSGLRITSNNSSTTTAISQASSITLVKSVAITTDAAPSGASLGDVQTFSFLVTNIGNVTLSAVGVTDPLAGLSAVSCPATTLAPNVSTTCTATRTITQADMNAGSINNTATASGTPPSGANVTSSPSSTSTAITQAPVLSLVKSVAITTDTGPTGASLNDVLTFSFAATNTGNVTLSLLSVSDALPGLSSILCPSTTLAPGTTITCTATSVITQDDVNAGSIINSASATATPPTGPPVTSNNSSTTTPIAQNSALSLVKSVAITTDAAPTGASLGDVQTFSFGLTNTGNVSLSGLSVSDPLVGLSVVTCLPTTLAPGLTATCSATRTITQADVNAGSIVNTANASGVAPSGSTVTSNNSSTTTPISQAPSLSLAKAVTLFNDADNNGAFSKGDTLTYTFSVSNSGNVTLSALSIIDPLPGLGTISCTVTTLAIGASTQCTAAYVVTQLDVDAGSINNTARASAIPPTGVAISSPNATVTTPLTRSASITLAKSSALTIDADASTSISRGDTLTYTFVVRNTGNVSLASVGVNDPMVGLSAVICPVSTLPPDAATNCTATYVVTQADVDAGTIANTATATAAAPNAVTVNATGTSTTSVPQIPSVTLTKTLGSNNDVDGSAGVTRGDTLTYRFAVSNTGNVALGSISVADPMVGLSSIGCPVTSIAPGATTVCTATYVVTQVDVDAGSIVNTAAATATAPIGTMVSSPNSTATTPIMQTTSLQMVKSVSIGIDADSSATVSKGDTLTYNFAVTNTGNVTISALAIIDPHVGLSPLTCLLATLAPNATTSCSANYIVTQADADAGSITNTAHAIAVNPSLRPVASPDDTVVRPVPQVRRVELIKSVNLTNDADTSTTVSLGDTITYSFNVTNTGSVTLRNIAITDPKPGLSAINCPVSPLNPGASATCTATYVVTQSDVDQGAIVNVASALATTPSGAVISSPTSTATMPVPQSASMTHAKTFTANADEDNNATISVNDTLTFSFKLVNTGNVTLTLISVSDLLIGASAVVCPAPALAPSSTLTCTATYVVKQADIDAGSITNSATATATPPSGTAISIPASTTVAVAQSASLSLTKTGSLTVDADSTTTVTKGDTFTYQFAVSNTGNVTLSALSISDPHVGLSPIVCPAGSVNPGVTVSCSATYVVTQADVDLGTVNNTAQALATTPSSTTVQSNQSLFAIAVPQTGDLRIVKTMNLSVDADNSTTVSINDTLTYQFAVSNAGNVSLNSLVVTDPLVGLSPIACPSTTLTPGSTVLCTATYVVTQADVDAGRIVNAARATARPPSGPALTTPNSSVTTLVPQSRQLATTKSVSSTVDSDGNNKVSVGDTLNYTFSVSNTGNVTVSNLVVNDSMPGVSTVNCAATTLAPNVSTTCTATYVVTQADADVGSVDNSATASGVTTTGVPVTSLLATVETSVPTVAVLTVLKSLSNNDDRDGSGTVTAGDTLTYTFNVQNTGQVTLSFVGIVDPKPGLTLTLCTAQSISPGATTICTGTYLVSQADIDAGTLSNTARAQGTTPVGVVLTSAPSTVTVSPPRNPVVSLTKSLGANNDADASTTVSFGDTLTYQFAITNTGNVTLASVGVNDPMVGLSAVTCPGGSLAPGVTVNCSAAYVVTQLDVDAGSIVNTATAQGTTSGGATVLSVPSTVTTVTPQGPRISLVKSLASNNDADGSSTVTIGDTLTYRFAVTNSGNVTLQSVSVDDALVGLSAVTCPTGPLAPRATATCTATYLVKSTDADTGSIVNTARASGVGPNAATVTSLTSRVTTPVVRIVPTTTTTTTTTTVPPTTTTVPSTTTTVPPTTTTVPPTIGTTPTTETPTIPTTINPNGTSSIGVSEPARVATTVQNQTTTTATIPPVPGAPVSPPPVEPASTGKISGTVWIDINGNGLLDPGEKAISGVKVRLLRNGVVVATTTAGPDFEFTKLADGDYTIEVDPTTVPPELAPSINSRGIRVTVSGAESVNIRFPYRPAPSRIPLTGTNSETLVLIALLLSLSGLVLLVSARQRTQNRN